MNENLIKRLPRIVELMSGFMDCDFEKLEHWGKQWRIYFKFNGTFRTKAIRELDYHFEEWCLNPSCIHSAVHSDGTFHIAITEDNLEFEYNKNKPRCKECQRFFGTYVERSRENKKLCDNCAFELDNLNSKTNFNKKLWENFEELAKKLVKLRNTPEYEKNMKILKDNNFFQNKPKKVKK